MLLEQILHQATNERYNNWDLESFHSTCLCKLHKLTHELNHYCWDIQGLPKIRWTRFGELTTDKSHKIWFSADDIKHQHGVAFIIWKEVTGSVISCTPISSRLISICILVKPHNITIIQAYVPTTDYEDVNVEEFYEQVDNIITKTKKHHNCTRGLE